MAIDTQQVGQFAMDAIEALADRYEDHEDIEVESMQLTVAFRNVPDGVDGVRTDVVSYSSDPGVTTQLGLAMGGLLSVMGASGG